MFNILRMATMTGFYLSRFPLGLSTLGRFVKLYYIFDSYSLIFIIVIFTPIYLCCLGLFNCRLFTIYVLVILLLSMAELKRIFTQRSSIRGKVTKAYNKRNDYGTYSITKIVSERANLEQCKEVLKDLNNQYEKLKFKDDDASEDYSTEIETCFDYELKLRECLLHLDRVEKLPNMAPSPTLLKQPYAPLPTFNHEKGDDLIKFLKEFELPLTGIHIQIGIWYFYWFNKLKGLQRTCLVLWR